MALKDWDKVAEMRYVSKNSCMVETAHYGTLCGCSELLCSKVDKMYFVVKMINGVRVSVDKFTRKTDAKKNIISQVKAGVY
jgi:hypothetical protein